MAVDFDNVIINDRLPGLEKELTVDNCRDFTWWPEWRNLHNDEDIARSVGFPTIMMMGAQGIEYISQMCALYFGQAWARTGKLKTTFLKPVSPPQRLKAEGIVLGKTHEGSITRFTIQVWLEDEDGDKVIVGTANAIV